MFKLNNFGKLYKIWYRNYENILEFITNIQDIKSKIKNIEITIYKTIIIWVLNYFNSFSTQFLSFLTYKTNEIEKLPKFESLAKFMKNKNSQIKNYNKATGNYIKKFIKLKTNYFYISLKFYSIQIIV